jgi:thymidylate kinase
MSLSRNVIIEFAGMPKSGKTTVMDVVVHYLKRSGVPIAEYHGGGRYAPLGKKDLARLNLYLACEAIRYCLTTHVEGSPARVHMLDRSLVDRMIFTNALESMERVSAGHSATIRNLFDIPELNNEEDLCFVFTTTPEISLSRESRNKLTNNKGRVMNTGFLEGLRKSALDFSRDNPRTSYVKEVAPVDTAIYDGEVTKTALIVLERVIPLLQTAGLNIPLPENE